MKRVLIAAFALSLLASCGSNDSSSSTGEKKDSAAVKPAENDLSSNPDYQKGLAIEASMDCATCHKLNERLVGPSFKEIATKYAGYIDKQVDEVARAQSFESLPLHLVPKG